MKFMSSLVISLSVLSLGTLASAQSVTYQNNQTIVGDEASKRRLPNSSGVRNNQTQGASISGKIRANFSYGENPPYSLSYLIRENIFDGFNSIPYIYGGMINPYVTSFIESGDPQLNLEASSIIRGIGHQFNVEFRGVNISRDSAEGDEMEDYGRPLGHTTYSYKRVIPGMLTTTPITILHTNWQNFNANLWGSWRWDVPMSFQWSPSYSGATITWNKWSMPFGSQDWTLARYRTVLNAEPRLIKPEGWEGWTGSERFQLDYTVSDDKGDAKNVYLLKVHDHLEKTGSLAEDIIEIKRFQIGSFAIFNTALMNPGTGNTCYPNNLPLPDSTVTENNTYVESISVNGDISIGEWAAIGYGQDWQTGYEIGVSVPVLGNNRVLPRDTYTYVVAIFTGRHFTGPGKCWEESGRSTDTTIDFTLPLPPGVSYQWPPIALGSGSGNGNSGGNSGGPA